MAKTVCIVTNAAIYTMDADKPVATTMAIGRDGRLNGIGTESEIGRMGGPGVQRIDLGGRTVLPGFFDCHLHMLWLGHNLMQVDLSSPPVKSIEDIVRLLSDRVAADASAPCILGNRYDQNKLKEKSHPDRRDLDKVATDRPVRIVHTSGHAAVVNSFALEALGIDRNTPDPQGGEIVRDAAGEPTGLLLETASWSWLDRIIPEATKAQNLDALQRTSKYLLSRGITSASDANTKPSDIDLYQEAVLRKALRVRTNLMVGWPELIEAEGRDPTPDEMQPTGCTYHELHVGQAKLFSDGAITTRTCWLTQPFEGTPENYGLPLHEPAELMDLVCRAHDMGWQIATHAIGDKAVDLVLKAYAQAQQRNTRRKPGHRIEHCMLLDKGLISRLRRQNVWSVGQPEFLSQLGDAYISALGEERAFRLSPYATLDDSGVAQAFSSDCPVVPGSPLAGIRAAVQRTTPNGVVLNADECISAEAAIYAYTAAPAYATRTERDRGTLSTGKFADFVVLSANPLESSFAAWDDLAVAATFVGGEQMYGDVEA